jgi:ubiquinone/menaquinone biosynthesis C-methylase UbiE
VVDKTYSENMRANYTRVAAAYDRTWADVLAVHARALADRLDLASVRRVMELGCGPGRLATLSADGFVESGQVLYTTAERP